MAFGLGKLPKGGGELASGQAELASRRAELASERAELPYLRSNLADKTLNDRVSWIFLVRLKPLEHFG